MAHTHAVIGQRGWIWVGRITTEGDDLVIRGGAVLRRWGTTRGLGELTGGPTAVTVLDPCGEVRIHRLAVASPTRFSACCQGSSYCSRPDCGE